jgi:hypothetical protein
MPMTREPTKTFDYSLHFSRILCFLFVLVEYSFACWLFALFFRSFQKIILDINLVGCFLLLGTFLLVLFLSYVACFVALFITIFVNAFVLVFLVRLNLSLLILLLRLVHHLDSFYHLTVFAVIFIRQLINDFLRFKFLISVI